MILPEMPLQPLSVSNVADKCPRLDKLTCNRMVEGSGRYLYINFFVITGNKLYLNPAFALFDYPFQVLSNPVFIFTRYYVFKFLVTHLFYSITKCIKFCLVHSNKISLCIGRM